MDRTTSLSILSSQKEPFDIVIVGGGASGLGAAVDAASRGHSVCLIEQSDFAKGTSSRSTKLVHGGVRYLKQGNVSLVLEALRERGLLCKNAPHLARSQPFIIPNYHWWEGPFYGIGLKVYDGLAGRLGLEPSRFLSREEVIAELPNIETKDLTGGVIYHDGQFDDSRLAINLAQTASEHGATVANYVRCEGLIKEKGHIAGVLAKDLENGTEIEIRARCVINATGVFADTLRQKDDARAISMLSPSQGVHIVLPRDFLPGNAAIMIPKTDDGRVLFAVPWHGRLVVGTTDTPVPEASLEPRALPEEIDFIFEEVTRYLARDPLRSDVLSVFAGLRPLVKQQAVGNTAALSRDHLIVVSDSGLITLTGGKWTTYRKMAEDVIDHAELIGALDHRRCVTQGLAIHGNASDHASPEHLRIYGSDATGIRDLITTDLSLGERLHPKLEFQKAEVVWHVRHEMARTVEDVLSRRTRALLLDARTSIEAARVVAVLMANELGRDQNWIESQIKSYSELANGYLLSDSNVSKK
jgi:glycerol-3-phosphate dehydrogenase